MTTETPLNRGAELLRDAGSISEVAAELGVTPRVVSTWRAGKIPSDDNQAALVAAYEIPRRAWHQRVEPEPESGPEPEYEVLAALEFRHPLALLDVYRATYAGRPTDIASLDATLASMRERHPRLVAACEAAERALGVALATEIAGDEFADAFLRGASVSSSTPSGGVRGAA